MHARLPSITDTEDFRTLAYALAHDGELPDWLSGYVHGALLAADWITGNKLTPSALAVAQKWADIRQNTTKGFRPSGAFTPRYLQD